LRLLAVLIAMATLLLLLVGVAALLTGLAGVLLILAALLTGLAGLLLILAALLTGLAGVLLILAALLTGMAGLLLILAALLTGLASLMLLLILSLIFAHTDTPWHDHSCLITLGLHRGLLRAHRLSWQVRAKKSPARAGLSKCRAGDIHIGGLTPFFSTVTLAAVSAPSGALSARMKTARPGLRSAALAGVGDGPTICVCLSTITLATLPL
jgi:hypothetical protein